MELVFYLENGGSMCLRNVTKLYESKRNHTVNFSKLVDREPQIGKYYRQ
jgi:hypothetical protein